MTNSHSFHRHCHRHRHRRGCACFLLTTLLKIIVTLLILLSLAVFILWLVFRPNLLKFHVFGASLTQFSFSGDHLRYNLALNITIRNPNKRIGIHYDTVEAAAVYKDRRLATRRLPALYQGHETTSVLSIRFDGRQVMLLGGEELERFNSEKLAGVYDVDVKLYLRLRLKFGVVLIGKFKVKVGCGLGVPLSPDGKLIPPFQTSGCAIDY